MGASLAGLFLEYSIMMFSAKKKILGKKGYEDKNK